MTTTYFKKYTGGSNSLVDALKAVGVKNPSKDYRQTIAGLNGISKYTGSESQNIKLLNLLKKGKLIKSVKKTNAEKFIDQMNKIHKGFLAYGKYFYYSYAAAEKTFSKALVKVKKGKKTGTTCVIPTRWGMISLGINVSGFYCKNGKFVGVNSSILTMMKRISSGKPIGMTVEQAVKANLLKEGDILGFKNRTHTVAYTGEGCKVFDGGSAAQSRGYSKVGIILDYSKVTPWKNEVISEILRWK